MYANQLELGLELFGVEHVSTRNEALEARKYYDVYNAHTDIELEEKSFCDLDEEYHQALMEVNKLFRDIYSGK